MVDVSLNPNTINQILSEWSLFEVYSFPLNCYFVFLLQIKNEIEKFKLQGIELEDQRKKILKELEDKQSVSSRDADEYEKKHTEISKILDQLRKGMWHVWLRKVLAYEEICHSVRGCTWSMKVTET